MTARLQLAADLEVELALPDRPVVHAALRGQGNKLDLEVDDPQVFAGRGDVGAVRAVADGLADQGVTVRVLSGGTHLITMGATRSPWWQRRLTGSRHIRLGSARGLWTSAKSRATSSGDPVLPDRDLVPPSAVSPVGPAFLRRPLRTTTTHAVRGGGDPKLVLVPPDDWPGTRHPYFRLPRPRTTIGSGEGCDIRLPGLAELHAEVVLDDNDEFVLNAHGGETRVNGERVASRLLRTASRVQVGTWTLTFYREEYADHGRPFGGRVGGEIGHQRPQPPRSDQTPSEAP